MYSDDTPTTWEQAVDESFDVIQAILEWEERHIPNENSGCQIKRCLSPLSGGGMWWTVSLGPMGRPKSTGYAPNLRDAFRQADKLWSGA